MYTNYVVWLPLFNDQPEIYVFTLIKTTFYEL